MFQGPNSRDFRSDFRSFVHRMSEVLCPSEEPERWGMHSVLIEVVAFRSFTHPWSHPLRPKKLWMKWEKTQESLAVWRRCSRAPQTGGRAGSRAGGGRLVTPALRAGISRNVRRISLFIPFVSLVRLRVCSNMRIWTVPQLPTASPRRSPRLPIECLLLSG